jgi:hypothetical protein
MYDDRAVRGDVHVELDGICSELKGALEGAKGILQKLSRRSPMTDSLETRSGGGSVPGARSGGGIRGHGQYIHRRARQAKAR